MSVKENQNNNNLDIEKQENNVQKIEQTSNNEPLEKAKVKQPPRINASLVLLYAIFLSMFAIGWIMFNACTVSRLIPIYLIVAGFVGAFAKFISKIDNRHIFNLTLVLVVFYFIWHCLGTYWVYREYQPNYNSSLAEPYCNRTAYLMSFWMLTFQNTLLVFFILLSACYMLMRGDFKK